ncbi:GNAT family N-acetyltransferase [Gordonia malaquae]|uniref:GNAT family N-acetyltransferase n=1 Tax=Gordonia malaquae TaxID=410332 RepID=UPI003BF8A992
MRSETHPLTSDRYDDLAKVVNPRRRAHRCRCLAGCPIFDETHDRWRETREQSLIRLSEHQPPAGVLVYRDGEAVGWCQVAARKWALSTSIHPSGESGSPGATKVWEIACIVVRPGIRRQGVTAHLIEGAVEYAASEGACAIESYPVNPRGRIDPQTASVGTKIMFDRTGFRVVGVTKMRVSRMSRLVMRRELS